MNAKNKEHKNSKETAINLCQKFSLFLIRGFNDSASPVMLSKL